MTEVVQECGGNQFVAGARFFGQRTALQCMFELRHRLSAISQIAVLLK
jgi:hypothetical protein